MSAATATAQTHPFAEFQPEFPPLEEPEPVRDEFGIFDDASLQQELTLLQRQQLLHQQEWEWQQQQQQQRTELEREFSGPLFPASPIAGIMGPPRKSSSTVTAATTAADLSSKDLMKGHNNTNSASDHDLGGGGGSHPHHHHHHHHEEPPIKSSSGRGSSHHPHREKPKMSCFRKMHFEIQRFRDIVGSFINDTNVQFFMVILIAINAVMMGIATFNFVRFDPEVNRAFELVDKSFLIVFTIELGCQFIYYGMSLFLDGWLVFDFIIITVSWSFSQLQIIRAFRIFRALRLITRIKVMKNLILALFGVMPRMFAIGLLLFLVSYIFAVMCTQLFKDMYTDHETTEDYFGRLDATFFTLFQMMTLDSWASITREVTQVYPWAWAIFVAFVIITGFVVVNLIIAVICDAVSALHDDEKAKIHGSYDPDLYAASDAFEYETPKTPVEYQDMVKDQLELLEQQVNHLGRMQEDTLRNLGALTKRMGKQRLRHEEQRQQQQQAIVRRYHSSGSARA